MNPPNEDLDLIASLEAADQSAARVKDLLPPVLGFDPDSKRGGAFGGFYAAADQVDLARYAITNAQTDTPFGKRVNGPGKEQQIPCVHLGHRTHFALVAAGPLHKKKISDEQEKYHFEAVVFVREITDQETNQPALFKLTLSGIAAVRLWSHFTQDIAEPLSRLTDHTRAMIKQLYEAKDPRITKERYENSLTRAFTAHEIWIPVDVVYEAQLGRDVAKAQIGTAPNTHTGEGKKRESRWKEIPVEALALIDTKGGLRLSETTAALCRDHRVKYETILKERAVRGSQNADLGVATETALAQSAASASAPASITPPPSALPAPIPVALAPEVNGKTSAALALTPAPPAAITDPSPPAETNSVAAPSIAELAAKIEKTGKTQDEVSAYLTQRWAKNTVGALSPAERAIFNMVLEQKLAKKG